MPIFPDIPKWFFAVCLVIFGIGCVAIAVTICRGIVWLINHVKIV